MVHDRNFKCSRQQTGMHNRAITVLPEQWMCLVMQRHTHITQCNLLIAISTPIYSPSAQAI